MAKTCHAAVSKVYIEAVCRAYVTSRAGFGSIPRPGQPRNSVERRNRSSLHGLRRHSRLFWRRAAARARLVLANASVSDPIAISSKSAALPGQTLRRQAFVPQLLVAF